MTTTASRKAKGRRLQQEVVKEILGLFLKELTARDVKSTPMGVSGMDVQLSEEASRLFPFAVECKSQEKLNIWDALEQAQSENRDNDLTPLVVFKRNRSKVYCALELKDLIRLIRKYYESATNIEPLGEK